MIIEEDVDRFQSNWGKVATSINLAAGPTTRLDATNIELAGNEFHVESMFGNGMGGLGFAAPTPTSTAGALDFVSSLVPTFSDLEQWDWHQWAIVLGISYLAGSYVMGKTRRATSSIKGYVRKRKDKIDSINRAREKYESAKADSGFFGGLFS